MGVDLGGLSSATAQMQLRVIGPNTIETAARLTVVRLLLRQFESPLVLILIFAAAVSLVLRQWTDSTVILAIILGSTLLGAFQEYRASVAIAELKRKLALTCTVQRDGMSRSLPANELVPGDIVLLNAGNLIPADGLIIDAQDFLVSQSSMTGESFPVEKRPGRLTADAPITQRINTVYMGSSVRSGTAKLLVVNTGKRTEYGAIIARLKSRPSETDFARGVRRFGYLLIRVMVLIVLFVLTVNLLLSRPVIESLLFAVALAVGLSPELLPAIVSVTLSAGARAMAARGVIVRRLDAIENLGSMDILCTDKTGTLTEGVVAMEDALDPSGHSSEDVRRLAFLNATFETGIENPLDTAIVAAGKESGLTTDGFAKVDEIPYDFLRRRLTIVLAAQDTGPKHLVLSKGAFSSVLETCSSVEQNGSEVPLTEDLRIELATVYQAKGIGGFRVLAIATREVEPKAHYTRDDERNMVFRGFLIFLDPPKADAKKTVSELADLGIRTKVITGDNRYVTAHIAESVGLTSQAVITGEQLANLRDEALWNLAPSTDLFVEIDPQQKERIVRALQRTGHCVGYLGDGINDAPALHAADVGISVESAVDVARESADIVLLKRDLSVLRRGIEDGRRTFANTLKYISITTSANFGNMVSMALAAPLLPFLPLAAKQILLNNFLSDIPSMAISTDNVDPEPLSRPQHWSIERIQKFMIIFGLISSIFDLITFMILLWAFRADEVTFRTSWFMVSLLTELGVIFVLRTSKPAFRSSPSHLLLIAAAMVSVTALAIPFFPSLNTVMGFAPPSALQIVSILGIVTSYLAVTEAAKRWFSDAFH